MRLDRRTPVALLLAAAAVLAATPAEAATAAKPAPKLVTIIGAPDVVVDVNDVPAAQRIPVRLGKGVNAKRLKVEPLLARQGRNRSAALLLRFSATLDPTKTPAVIAVAIVDYTGTDAPLKPGTYRLVVDATDGRRHQRLALNVIVPAVTLAADPKFDDIEATVGFAPIDLGLIKTHSSPSPRLVLAPTSTQLTDITISVPQQPDSGTIDFEAPAGASLLPGEALPLSPVVDGTSPGTYTGTVEVHADQLAKPVTFPYKVVVERSDWCIVLIVAAGFLIGLIVRKGLVALLARLRAARAAYDYAEELDTAITVAADATFRSRLVQARDVLLTQLGKLTAEAKITKAVSDATAAATAARAEYEASYTAQSAALTKLRDAIPVRTRIAVIDDVIAQITERATAAAARLGASDPTGAKAEIDAADVLLTGTLPDRVDQWTTEARGLLDAVDDVPVRERASIDALVAKAREHLDAVDKSGAATAERLTAANAAIGPLRYVVQEVLADVRTVTDRAWTLIAALRAQGADGGGADPATLRVKLAQAKAALASGAVGQPGALAAMTEALTDLGGELDDQALAWSPLDKAEAVLLVGDQKIVEALTPTKTAELATLGDKPAAAAVAAAADSTGEVDRGAAPEGDATTANAVPSPVSGAAPAVPAAWVDRGSRSNRWQLVLTYLAVTLVLAALFSLIGWLSYHEQFVGTTQEMLGIFLWAFATDLTIEGLAAYIDPLKAAPKKAA